MNGWMATIMMGIGRRILLRELGLRALEEYFMTVNSIWVKNTAWDKKPTLTATQSKRYFRMAK
jgi:hypothetical protein